MPNLFAVNELDNGSFLWHDFNNNEKEFDIWNEYYTGIFKAWKGEIEHLHLKIVLFLIKQTENSQLNMKISGMERKSSGKRDSFLAQTKDAKENKKPPVKVCFSKLYLIELLIVK